jgi:hypothetical protein
MEEHDLEWSSEEESRLQESSDTQRDDSGSKSEEGLCRVEDPTCEACQ